MSYSLSLMIILVTMLVGGIVYRCTDNKTLKSVFQSAAVIWAIVAFYFHYKAQVSGEYHKFSQNVAEHIVKAIQGMAKSNIGSLIIDAVHFFNSHEWAIYLLSAIIVIGMILLPMKKGK